MKRLGVLIAVVAALAGVALIVLRSQARFRAAIPVSAAVRADRPRSRPKLRSRSRVARRRDLHGEQIQCEGDVGCRSDRPHATAARDCAGNRSAHRWKGVRRRRSLRTELNISYGCLVPAQSPATLRRRAHRARGVSRRSGERRPLAPAGGRDPVPRDAQLRRQGRARQARVREGLRKRVAAQPVASARSCSRGTRAQAHRCRAASCTLQAVRHVATGNMQSSSSTAVSAYSPAGRCSSGAIHSRRRCSRRCAGPSPGGAHALLEDLVRPPARPVAPLGERGAAGARRRTGAAARARARDWQTRSCSCSAPENTAPERRSRRNVSSSSVRPTRADGARHEPRDRLGRLPVSDARARAGSGYRNRRVRRSPVRIRPARLGRRGRAHAADRRSLRRCERGEDRRARRIFTFPSRVAR